MECALDTVGWAIGRASGL